MTGDLYLVRSGVMVYIYPNQKFTNTMILAYMTNKTLSISRKNGQV